MIDKKSINEENSSVNEIAHNEEMIREKLIISEKENVTEKETGTQVEREENKEIDENKTAKEIKKENKSNSSNSTASSTGGSMGGISGAIATVAAVVIIVTTTMFGNIKAAFTRLDIFGTYIDYTVEVSMDYQISEDIELDINNLDTGLRLVVYNSEYELIVPLVTGDDLIESSVDVVSSDDETMNLKFIFSGKIEGLKEKNRYKMEIIGDENGSTKKYLTESVKTTGLISKFNDISYKCNCAVDGKFYFNLNYLDEKGYYTNFEYEFKSKDTGEISLFGLIDNPKEQQAIDVTELKGTQFVLVIKYKTEDPDDKEKGIEQIIKEFDIEI